MSGDVESNPGPVQSRPVHTCNNDPRVVRLEKALQRRDEKIATLIKKMRQEIKNKKIYTQGFFVVVPYLVDLKKFLSVLISVLLQSQIIHLF